MLRILQSRWGLIIVRFLWNFNFFVMPKKRVRHHVNPLADRTEHYFDGFENNHPIIVDIGADHGEFTYALLEKWGEKKNFILFEIRKPRAMQLRRKFSNYTNVAIFDGDAVRNFANVLKPSVLRGVTIEEIYINFPDPWFKERHKKRRIIKKEFLIAVRQWLSCETKWYFQTDQKTLFDETVEVLEDVGGIDVNFLNNSPHGVMTKWEKAKIVEGKKIYRMCFSFTCE